MGRLFCIMGAGFAIMGLDKEYSTGGGIYLRGFLFTALGLHALAVWRDHRK